MPFTQMMSCSSVAAPHARHACQADAGDADSGLCSCIVAALCVLCSCDARAAVCAGCALSGGISGHCGSTAAQPASSSSGTPSSTERRWAPAQPVSSQLACSTGGRSDNELRRTAAIMQSLTGRVIAQPASICIGHQKHEVLPTNVESVTFMVVNRVRLHQDSIDVFRDVVAIDAALVCARCTCNRISEV